MSEHTPLPWVVYRARINSYILSDAPETRGRHVVDHHVGQDRHGHRPGQLRSRADAEFIVRACNAHDALVYALRGLLALTLKALPGLGGDHQIAADPVIAAARAAIARAEGK